MIEAMEELNSLYWGRAEQSRAQLNQAQCEDDFLKKKEDDLDHQEDDPSKTRCSKESSRTYVGQEDNHPPPTGPLMKDTVPESSGRVELEPRMILESKRASTIPCIKGSLAGKLGGPTAAQLELGETSGLDGDDAFGPRMKEVDGVRLTTAEAGGCTKVSPDVVVDSGILGGRRGQRDISLMFTSTPDPSGGRSRQLRPSKLSPVQCFDIVVPDSPAARKHQDPPPRRMLWLYKLKMRRMSKVQWLVDVYKWSPLMLEVRGKPGLIWYQMEMLGAEQPGV